MLPQQAQTRTHLNRHGPCHNHQIGLTRTGTKHFRAKARQIILRGSLVIALSIFIAMFFAAPPVVAPPRPGAARMAVAQPIHLPRLQPLAAVLQP